ncbi:MAG TPA: ribosome recycling factor [candidate division Zixibacteria bacterium]|nr:ribosome recycling factor [candidate division Zixibacteria bacterium]
MLDALKKDIKDRMHKSVETVDKEFRAVRTGKANAHLLDTVRVQAYGTSMPINQVATVNAPEPRLIVLQAFDKTVVGEIVKAIQAADLGLNPIPDGQLIRVPIPALNEDRRKELVKHCHKVAEDGRVAVRNIRREANDSLKKLQKEKKISEDEERKSHDEVQKITDEQIKLIDEHLKQKEKEVMEV